MNQRSDRVALAANIVIYSLVGLAVVGVCFLLEDSAARLNRWLVYLYGSLFVAYMLLERWAYRGSEGTGQQAHRGLRYLLNLAWWAVVIAPLAEYALTARHNGWVTALGLTLAVAGTALRMWGVRALGRYFSGHIETYADHTLVESGPYAFIRHPAYAGNILHVLGLPLILNAYFSLVLSALVIALFIRRLLWEEQALAEQVPGYAAYRERTHRLIPGLW